MQCGQTAHQKTEGCEERAHEAARVVQHGLLPIDAISLSRDVAITSKAMHKGNTTVEQFCATLP